MIIPLPAKRSISFAGILCARRGSPERRRRASAPSSGTDGRLSCPPSPGGIAPRWRAGRFPSPVLPSRLPGSRISARAVKPAHLSIRMRGLARALVKSQDAERRLPNSRDFPRTAMIKSRPRAASSSLFCAPLRAVRRGGDRVYISKDSIYIITVRF